MRTPLAGGANGANASLRASAMEVPFTNGEVLMARPGSSAKPSQPSRTAAAAVPIRRIRCKNPSRSHAFGINRLLCMFNGFAIPKPFCLSDHRHSARRGIGPPDRVARWARGPARGRVGRGGTAQADGVNRPVHFSHHIWGVPAGARQPDERYLDHPGVARRRPDDRPGPDRPGIHRHHQPGHSSIGHGDRAGRAGRRGVLHSQQARQRFRNHRDERRGHAAVAPAETIHRCHRSSPRCC